jgi:hypothetical protein
MNWLFRWLSRRIHKAINDSYVEEKFSRGGQLRVTSSSDSLRSQGMNFTVHNVSGGYVVEYHSYDDKTDTSINNIHIITDDQDVGEQLSKILTLELLRK